MRSLLAWLVLGVAGCSAGEAASPLDRDVPVEVDGARSPEAVASETRRVSGRAEVPRDSLATVASFEGPTDGTSRAAGDAGATYIAGLFSGALTLGGTDLVSRGAEDVYVARVDADGSVAWARAVGSRRGERGPRVTFHDDRVYLIAEAGGEVDCGQGPSNTWSSRMFFLCVFAPDGTPIHGGTFPTGSP